MISPEPSRELLIHPGFHKTGTTFLQECVFSDERYFCSLLDHGDVDRLLLRPHDLEFDEGLAREEIARRMDPVPNSAVPVLSSETLSGNILTGARDSRALARRLHAVFPRAKILFTVRKQPALMKSAYLQYAKRGGRLKPAQFFDFNAEPGYDRFDIGVLSFDRLVDEYASLYGGENVLVLPQELLRQDQGKFLSLLFEFAGVASSPPVEGYEGSRGKSPPEAGLALLRAANLFDSTPFQPRPAIPLPSLGRGLRSLSYRLEGRSDSKSGNLGRIVSEKCSNRFANSNRNLQKYCPIDLTPLGYDVSS